MIRYSFTTFVTICSPGTSEHLCLSDLFESAVDAQELMSHMDKADCKKEQVIVESAPSIDNEPVVNSGVPQTEGLSFCMTPALLETLNTLLPDHTYDTHVPISILLDPKLGIGDLQSLLRGTKVWFPPKVAPVVNVDYQARMQRLREMLEERQYQSMVHTPVDSSLASSRGELRELKNQLSTIVNIFISIFTAAMASWYWTPHWRPGSRVLAAFGSALGLGAIEAFLYFRYLAKIELSKRHDEKQNGKTSLVMGQGKKTRVSEDKSSAKKKQ